MNYAWQIKTINILDSIDENGLDKTKAALDQFSTKRSDSEHPLNEEIEKFLKNNAIQFAKEKKSITYLVIDMKKGNLLGYFTLTHKIVKIPLSILTNTKKRRIERYAKFDKVLNAYPVSAFLIAQFGKNYALNEENRISGNDLMKLVDRELYEVQYRIGGGLKFLECEPDVKLIKFYQNQNFVPFDNRVSEKDQTEYVQLMKFL